VSGFCLEGCAVEYGVEELSGFGGGAGVVAEEEEGVVGEGGGGDGYVEATDCAGVCGCWWCWCGGWS